MFLVLIQACGGSSIGAHLGKADKHFIFSTYMHMVQMPDNGGPLTPSSLHPRATQRTSSWAWPSGLSLNGRLLPCHVWRVTLCSRSPTEVLVAGLGRRGCRQAPLPLIPVTLAGPLRLPPRPGSLLTLWPVRRLLMQQRTASVAHVRLLGY